MSNAIQRVEIVKKTSGYPTFISPLLRTQKQVDNFLVNNKPSFILMNHFTMIKKLHLKIFFERNLKKLTENVLKAGLTTLKIKSLK